MAHNLQALRWKGTVPSQPGNCLIEKTEVEDNKQMLRMCSIHLFLAAIKIPATILSFNVGGRASPIPGKVISFAPFMTVTLLRLSSNSNSRQMPLRRAAIYQIYLLISFFRGTIDKKSIPAQKEGNSTNKKN